MSVLVVALALRCYGLSWGLPQIYEEAFPFTTAWQFWNWGAPGLTLNPHFFNYPALTFYVQFLLQAVHFIAGFAVSAYPTLDAYHAAFELNPTSFITLARLATVAFDVGSVGMIYLIGSRLADRRTALAAAILLAVNPLHIRLAQMVNVDVPLGFFALCAIYAVMRLQDTRTARAYVLSGLVIGLAASTKYTGALLLLPFLVAHFLHPDRRTMNSLLTDKLLALSTVLAGATFFVLNPYILIDAQGFLTGFGFERSHMAVGHLGLDPSEGSGAFYLFTALPAIMGWPALVLSVCGGVLVIHRRQRRFYPLLAFLVVYGAVVSGWSMRADRYLLPAVPILLILAASGATSLVEWMTRVSVDATRAAALPLVLVAMAATPMMGMYSYHHSHMGKDTRTAAADWIEAHVASGSSVAMTAVGINVEPRKIFSVSIPFHPVYPEQTIPFYDPDLYSDVDIVVVSSFDYGRFLTDSVKYQPFIAFYRSLERTGTTLAMFHPAADQSGPDIRLIRPRSSSNDSIPVTAIARVAAIGDEAWVVDALGRLGLVSFLKGRYGRSAAFFTAVVSLSPDNLPGLKHLAQSLLQADQPGEAQRVIEQYLAHSPGASDMTELHAISLLGQGKTEEAEREFLGILAIDPHNATAYAGLSSLYEQLGEKAKLVDILMRNQRAVGVDSEQGRLLALKIAQIRGF